MITPGMGRKGMLLLGSPCAANLLPLLYKLSPWNPRGRRDESDTSS